MNYDLKQLREYAKEFYCERAEVLEAWNAGLQTWNFSSPVTGIEPEFRCVLCKDSRTMNKLEAFRHISGKKHKENLTLELLAL